MVDLVPMTAAEFDAFCGWLIPDYAASQVRSGNWTAEDAEGKSRAEFAKLLPQGATTPDHYFRHIVAGSPPERVGALWYAVRRGPASSQLFIYWVGIDERFRRRGYAVEAFRAVDAEAGRLGAATIGLHVFGDNTSARALYDKIGFVTTDLRMTRPVPAPARPPPG